MSSEQWLKTIDFIQDAYEAGSSDNIAAGLGKLAAMAAAGALTEAYLRTAMPMIRLGYAISGRSDQWAKWTAFSGWAAGEITGKLLDEFNDLTIGAHIYDWTHPISNSIGTTPDPLVKTIRYVQYSDPLVLDLNGDGLKITPLSQGVLFDANGDTTKNSTAWIDSADGMLVWDRNSDGTINSGGELFGDETVLANGQKADNGFAALSELDVGSVVNGVTVGAGDGVFNASDAQYANLRVWRDFNQDGISQADELKTLAESGVQSIALGSTATSTNYGDAILVQNGTFTRTDGSTGQAGNFILAQNFFVREFAPIVISDAAKALPVLKGTGWVRDLQDAATLDPELITLLNLVKAAPTRAEFKNTVANLIRSWGNDSDYNNASKQALAAGYGLILSDPQDDQERGWMDPAIKASEADRNTFRATLCDVDRANLASIVSAPHRYKRQLCRRTLQNHSCVYGHAAAAA